MGVEDVQLQEERCMMQFIKKQNIWKKKSSAVSYFQSQQ
jgi:hypothetical protein